jgi:membrane-associated protease RseP (regulator of RpoE activity)
MRLAYIASFFLACLLAAWPAHAQTRLQQLENKLSSPAGKPATDPAGAPGTGYIGFVPDEAAEDGIGCVVLTVKKGGPSDVAGLSPGDIITAINGKACRNFTDLDAVLAQSSPGTKLTMTVNRGGMGKTLTITLGRKPIEARASSEPAASEPGEPPAPSLLDPLAPAPETSKPNLELPEPAPGTAPRPGTGRPSFDPLGPTTEPAPGTTPPRSPAPGLAAPGTPVPGATAEPETPVPPSIDLPGTDSAVPEAAGSGRPSLGISVFPLTEEVRASFSISPTVRRGAVIQSIRPGSPADTAGLPLGGVVVAANGQRIDTADDLVSFVRASRPGQEVELTYYVGDRLTRKSVRLGAAAAVAVVPEGSEAPAPRSVPGTDRPLLRKFENLIDPLITNPPRTPAGSTILDPSAIAALQDQVKQMEERIQALEERIKLLEGK